MATRPHAAVGASRRLRAAIAAVVVGLALTSLARADPAAVPQAEIDHLLNFVGTSPCTFIRNGTGYPAAEARSHLAGKFQFAKGRITTAEEFIRSIATESSTSSEPYRVRCAGKEMPAGAWLADELHRFRKVTAAAGVVKPQ